MWDTYNDGKWRKGKSTGRRGSAGLCRQLGLECFAVRRTKQPWSTREASCKVHVARGHNLLGALVTAVNDRMQWNAEKAIGLGGPIPAALVTIGHNYGESVEFLSGILQMSHSGCVRLVDKLDEQGLIERRPGKDRRSLSLYLTPKGRELKREVLRARREALDGILETLDVGQQRDLVTLLEVILTGITHCKNDADIICRLCEEQVCAQSHCPVTIGSVVNASL
jgi:MarR family transcriptional regulator, negative regulator of the multidrug operon emrRAB